MMKLFLFTDNPIASIIEDKFGFDTYANVLKDAILQAKPLPFCVGIFGAWGSGKSSFMRMIEDLIKAQVEQTGDKIKTIWFNPWKYDKKEELWNALIQTILHSIASEDKAVEGKAKDLAVAATWLAMKKAISVLTAGVITEANLDDVVKSFTEKEEKYYQYINQFEKTFAEVVHHYTDGGKLVIFVDDLDRCLPENAITVLEALKLYIGDANCIFVLGILVPDSWTGP
jgi:predicted KAP-like P-loop ATPase